MTHFLLYATANELDYSIDLSNFERMLKHRSGVTKVSLFIAVSLINEKSEKDEAFLKKVRNYFKSSAQFDFKSVIFTSNIGRDFSSYGAMLREAIKISDPDDFVLFQNRSALGPENSDWYARMVAQFCKFENVGLCGATINFCDHPVRSNSTSCPHVQTYVFLSQMKFLYDYENDFPGENEVDRVKLILKGEIGLSEHLLNRGYALTCLEWPNAIIDRNSEAKDYSEQDIKTATKKKQDFIHRRVFEGSSKLSLKSYFTWYSLKLKYLFFRG